MLASDRTTAVYGDEVAVSWPLLVARLPGIAPWVLALLCREGALRKEKAV
jgi:hypothetical protein